MPSNAPSVEGNLTAVYDRIQFLLGLDNSEDENHSALYEECSNFHVQKYNLREDVRKREQNPVTWIDRDDSGNYDPNKTKLTWEHAKRKRAAIQDIGTSSPQQQPNKKPKTITWASGRKQGKNFVVSLKLSSEASRIVLKDVCDSVPRGYFEPSNSPEPSQDFSDFYSRCAEPNSPPADFHSLEERQSSTFDQDDDTISANPSELLGCRGCHSIGIICSLVENESLYPCNECVEEGHDCELFLEPAKKKSCESCNRKRIKCSYRDPNYDHSYDCEPCLVRGTKCLAGADTALIIKEGGFVSKSKLRQDRKDYCRNRSYYSSSRDEKDHLRGTHRDKNLDYSSKKANRSKKNKSPALTIQETFPKPVDQVVNEDPQARLPHHARKPRRDDGRKGTTKTIMTAFSHPIMFNYNPLAEEAPCNWCVSVGYGVTGLGRRRATVIDWGDGIGYDEVSDGHRGEGKSQSRMCLACTTDRMEILACSRHDFQQILGRSASTFDFFAAYSKIQEGMPLDDEGALWCALCPSPAFYECCTIQTEGNNLGDVMPGCGLFLCESCTALVEKFKGDLQRMFLGTEQTLTTDFPIGFRADALFLRREGELFRQIHKGILPYL